jgi:hypothetical protein
VPDPKDRDKRDKAGREDDGPVDLAARIGRARPEDQSAEQPPTEPTIRDDAKTDRPIVIGMDEPVALPPTSSNDEEEKSEPIISVRGAPSFGEMDLVVTPLPTPDDWHRFEIALRKLRGITQLRPEYYRHGVAKMRVSWEGNDRLAAALRSGIPGYRVRVIGEDRSTIQILVSSGTEDRRPG